MSKKNLRSEVLRRLQRSENGLLQAELGDQLVKDASFADEVATRAELSLTLLTLKHEHRAWPHKGQRWKITSKGKKSYV